MTIHVSDFTKGFKNANACSMKRGAKQIVNFYNKANIFKYYLGGRGYQFCTIRKDPGLGINL